MSRAVWSDAVVGPGETLVEVYVATWSCDKDSAYNIELNDHEPEELPASGATALLTLF